MSRFDLARYVNPWKFRRVAEAQRLAAIRRRDGDNCSRCRRPLRFDLPAGHDAGAKVEAIRPGLAGDSEALDNLCLCHGRCNANAGDATPEVSERVRRKSEAALFTNARSRRRA